MQLAVFDAGFAVYVDKVDSPQPLKAMTSIGSRLPATVTSTGKAMLAWLLRGARSAMAQVKRFTPLTLTRRKDIERDLEETRERGYAVNHGEFRVGVCGIAAPLRDRSGHVVAAIGVWGAETNILGARAKSSAAGDRAARATPRASWASCRALGLRRRAAPRSPRRRFADGLAAPPLAPARGARSPPT